MRALRELSFQKQITQIDNTRVLIKRSFSCGCTHISHDGAPPLPVCSGMCISRLRGRTFYPFFPILSLPPQPPLWILETHKKFGLDFPPLVVYHRKPSFLATCGCSRFRDNDENVIRERGNKSRDRICDIPAWRRDNASLQVRGIVISYLHACFWMCFTRAIF